MGKRILCGIFGFYLTLALIVPQLFITCYTYYYRESNLAQALCGDDMAQLTYDQILSDATAIAVICHLPETVFDGVFSPAQVQDDMKTALHLGLQKEKYEPELQSSLTILAENVRNFLSGVEDFGDISEYEKDIDRFCTRIQSAYQQGVSLYAYRQFPGIQRAINSRLQPAGYVSAALILICLFLLWRCLRNPGALLREISFSMIAAAACSGLASYLLWDAKILNQIQVSPMYFREALGSYLQGGLIYNMVISAVTGLLGLLLFFLAAILIHRYNRRLKQPPETGTDEATA